TLRTVGEEAERCVPEIIAWIEDNLAPDYSWPGNYRELEQCVRNVIIRRSYQPIQQQTPAQAANDFLDRFHAGDLTADEAVTHYAACVYRITGSYEAAAKRMKLDRRTVKAKVAAYLRS